VRDAAAEQSRTTASQGVTFTDAEPTCIDCTLPSRNLAPQSFSTSCLNPCINLSARSSCAIGAPMSRRR
jgi:hypothetical protein